MKELRKKSEARCSNETNTLPYTEEIKKAVTIKEIKEYIGDYPYKLLTPKEENKVREEIVFVKNGGSILDGIVAELEEKQMQREMEEAEMQYYNSTK